MVWDFHGFPVFKVQMFFVWLTSQHDFLDSLVKVQFLSILLICVDGLCHQSHLEELQGSSLLNWLHHKPLMWIDGLYYNPYLSTYLEVS